MTTDGREGQWGPATIGVGTSGSGSGSSRRQIHAIRDLRVAWYQGSPTVDGRTMLAHARVALVLVRARGGRGGRAPYAKCQGALPLSSVQRGRRRECWTSTFAAPRGYRYPKSQCYYLVLRTNEKVKCERCEQSEQTHRRSAHDVGARKGTQIFRARWRIRRHRAADRWWEPSPLARPLRTLEAAGGIRGRDAGTLAARRARPTRWKADRVQYRTCCAGCVLTMHAHTYMHHHDGAAPSSAVQGP